MSERLTLTLYNAQQGHQAILHAWMDCLKPMLMAGHRMVLKAQKETRSLEQNSRTYVLVKGLIALPKEFD